MIENDIFINKINKKLRVVSSVFKETGIIVITPNTCEVMRIIGKRFRIKFLMVMGTKISSKKFRSVK